MEEPVLNPAFGAGKPLLFAGDYEVVGPDPWLGHREVAGLGLDLIFVHYHHRHEFEVGHPRGLWGSICPESDDPDWSELDRTIRSAKSHFPKVALYPIGWAHMVPQRLGETVLDVDPEVLADWVFRVVERYEQDVDLFPIFYELNVFDLFFNLIAAAGYRPVDFGALENARYLEPMAMLWVQLAFWEEWGPNFSFKVTGDIPKT